MLETARITQDFYEVVGTGYSLRRDAVGLWQVLGPEREILALKDTWLDALDDVTKRIRQ